MGNKVVYTVNFGTHDLVREPFKTEGWDYILFTNNDIKDTTWEVRKVELPIPDKYAARHVYINSHLFVPEYEYSVMIGGQIQLIGDIDGFIKDYYDLTKDINILRHPCRTCIYKESDIIIREKIDIPENVLPQMDRYKNAGFPQNYGLSACGIIGRKKTKAVADFERAWWQEVVRGSFRDQLSFDYIRWKQDFTMNWVTYNVLFGKYFSVFIRGTNRRIGGLG
jgi:hypothetical protein